MKRPLRVLFLVAGVLAASLTMAADLPETGLRYDIEVRLDPETRMLHGSETIRWTNPSSGDVDRIPIHLYLNAFSHEDTTWIRNALRRRLRDTEVSTIYRDPWGYSRPTSIVRDGQALPWRAIAPDDGNPFDRSLIEVSLSPPASPGETVVLELEFEARLPIPFARTGGYEDFFFAGQWFPKIAMFETAGTRGAPEDRWNAHQFHGMTEFYAEYADFDVRIGVPAGWAVVATGTGGLDTTPGDGVTDWFRFRQRAVHDFAFSAGANMVDVMSRHIVAGRDGDVEIHVFTPRGTEDQVPRWRRVVEACLDVTARRIAPYPYDSVTVVLPPNRAMATWGMEYPTLFTGLMGDPFWSHGVGADLRLNEATIAHEYAHQYFYGLIGTNEFEDAFLDEGFTEFLGFEITIELFGDEGGNGSILGKRLDVVDQLQGALRSRIGHEYPPILDGPSFLVRGYNKGRQFYMRPASILKTAERRFGRDQLDRVLQLYYERWSFGHPGFDDFITAARDAAGDELADFMVEAFTRPIIPDYRVDKMTVDPWRPPDGKLVDPDGVTEWTDEADPLRALDPAALEADGMLLAEIVDPGRTRGRTRHLGWVERRVVAPEIEDVEREPVDEDEFYVSEVRLDGPGWDHLPVEVVFRFEDGATFRDEWDGKSRYRIYRFVRPARLDEVAIDPDRILVLDGDRLNNSRRRTPDPRTKRDWSSWFGALAQTISQGLWEWL